MIDPRERLTMNSEPKQEENKPLSLQEMHDQIAASIEESKKLRDEIDKEIKRKNAIFKAIKKQLGA